MPDGEQDAPIIVIPDSGPLITLAYADSLDLLHADGNDVWVVDMIAHEVTRNRTPTGERIGRWIAEHADDVVTTELFAAYERRLRDDPEPPRKSNLGELAAQEVMNLLARTIPLREAVFLFEDHKLARAGFVLPDNCMRISTRAWLGFLEQTGRIDSAAHVERHALENGRAFSTLHYPPEG